MEDHENEQNYDEGGGISCLGCGCQFYFLGGCFFFIALIVGFFYVVTSKPVSAWEPIVNYLNADIEVENRDVSNLNYSEIQEVINSQITAVGENKVVIKEEHLTVLARNNFEPLDGAIVDVEDEMMYIYWELDKTIEDNPLYGVAGFSAYEENLTVKKLGTKRISAPSIFNKFLTNTILNVLQLGDQDKSNNLVLELLDANSQYDVREIEFIEDSIVLTIYVEVNFL